MILLCTSQVGNEQIWMMQNSWMKIHFMLCSLQVPSILSHECFASFYLIFKVPAEFDDINIQYSDKEYATWWDCDFYQLISTKSHSNRIQTQIFWHQILFCLNYTVLQRAVFWELSMCPSMAWLIRPHNGQELWPEKTQRFTRYVAKVLNILPGIVPKVIISDKLWPIKRKERNS